MATTQQLDTQQKQELNPAQERVEAGKFYSPYTDVYETAEAVVLVMEMPGVDRSAIDVRLDKNVLTLTGNIDSTSYEGLEPIYTEYNVGNFTRSFTVSTKIDSDGISARIDDGILTVTLPKAREAVARRIEVH